MVRLSLKVHLPAAHEWYGWTVILASRERLELLQKSCNRRVVTVQTGH